MRAAARHTPAVVLALALAACGSSVPPGPTPIPPPGNPDPPVPADCHAINYAGETGGERIQNAVDNRACGTVYISPDGPDTAGMWLVAQSIRLRSDLTVTSTTEGRPAVLRGANGVRMLVVDGQSDVVLRWLTLWGAKSVPSGLVIIGARRVEFTRGTIRGMNQFGIVLRDVASSDVRVSASAFEDNGFIDVRTQTNERNAFHVNVIVENNAMVGTAYGVAFANCGGSPGAACHARNNDISPKGGGESSGVDLNRSHAAIVSGNRILGVGGACVAGVTCRCGYGVTVDDTQSATIQNNIVDGCAGEGILLGNGAVPENRPWWVSGNEISGNTLRNNGGIGLASFRNPSDSLDNNVFNTFGPNRIEGNAGGGCRTNAEHNTFFGNGPQECPPQTAPTTSSMDTRGADALPRWLRRRGPAR